MKDKNPLAQGQFGWSYHFENFIIHMFVLVVGTMLLFLFLTNAPPWILYLTGGTLAYFGGSFWLLIVIKIIVYRMRQ